MADAIEKKFGAKSELIEGSGGVFDVHIDGTQIWNKHDVGRFPEHEEILGKIESLKAS